MIAETGIPVAGQETIAPPRALRLLRPLQLAGPFLIALLVGAVVLFASGRDAIGTYWLLAQQSLGGTSQIANTLVAATPVLLTGLATAVAFRSGIFNVGVEGSLYVGAFAAAWAGFTLKGLPGPLLIMVAIVLAGAAGALWARGPRPPRGPARAVGINLAGAVIIAFVISGILGGVAGGFQILGVNYRFIDHFSPGYGFTGIAVALLGRGHPIGIVLAALFFGALSSGGAMIQLFSDIPLDLINILQGTVMIFAVIELSRLPFVKRWLRHA